MSQFLEPLPLRRTVSTPLVDTHRHFDAAFAVEAVDTPLSGLVEHDEHDTVRPNLLFLNAEAAMNTGDIPPSTPLNRSYSVPYYAAIHSSGMQNETDNYGLAIGGGHVSPYQMAMKSRSAYTPMEVNGLMTPVSCSQVSNLGSFGASPTLSRPYGKSIHESGVFLTPVTPPTSIPSKNHTGVKLDYQGSNLNDTDSPGGVNPFYSPPSYMMTTLSQNKLDDHDRKFQVAHAAAVALDVHSFTPPELQDSSADATMMPSPASSAEYQELLDSLNKENNKLTLRKTTSRDITTGGGAITKSHRCETCSKTFRRLEHLKRHVKIHTAERPFVCDVPSCNRRFSRSDNLRAHRRTHMKQGGRNEFVENLVA